MRIILTFGKQSFNSAQKNWCGEIAQLANKVSELIDSGQFSNYACNEQEVYEVNNEPLYNEVKIKIQEWKHNPHLQTKEQYQFIREVQYW